MYELGEHTMACCGDRPTIISAHSALKKEVQAAVEMLPVEEIKRLATRYLCARVVYLVECQNCKTTEYRIEDEYGYIEIPAV